jgi:hypothetical protein
MQFQTQQVHCIRDQNGAITEGGQVNMNLLSQNVFPRNQHSSFCLFSCLREFEYIFWYLWLS